jgi:proline dehydrogenase
MLRTAILALSRSGSAAHVAATMPGIRGFSRRFVAGERRDDVVDAVARLNAQGFEATVSHLGEDVRSEREVEAAMAELLGLIAAVREGRMRSHISVKLTELGLAFDEALAERSLEHVVAAAEAAGTFVRIDMEDSRYTDVTLRLFRDARLRHDNVGVVIQAYLRRSDDDIAALAQYGAPVRLVKGAYREPEDVAYQKKSEVDAAFVRLTDRYFELAQPGARLAVATHDARMVREALRSARRHGVGREGFEFQMLYGIRTGLQRTLRDRGYTVRVYVPYGSHWYPYLMRRLAERPANLWFFLRGAFRR